MIEQTKDCETCYGTGNEPRMISPKPGRKDLLPALPPVCRHRQESIEARCRDPHFVKPYMNRLRPIVVLGGGYRNSYLFLAIVEAGSEQAR